MQGQLFGLAQSNANQWIHLLHPILTTARTDLGVCPARSAVIGDADDEDETTDADDGTEQNAATGSESGEQVPLFFMMARSDR